MKLLIIEAAALGYELWESRKKAEFWNKLNINAIETVFPAVTCSVQASFRTAAPPSVHGMIANGFFNRELKKTFFWEQASTLYSGERIWEDFRKNKNSVGQICFQQSIGTDSDMILSPAPIHKHHGGMIQDFYARPKNLYHKLCAAKGKKFNLHSYWGPFTSYSSTEWIRDAAIELLRSGEAADLLLVYLPHLDYEMQKSGPDSKSTFQEFTRLETSIEALFATAKLSGYEVVIFGDYAINKAEQALFPNKILKNENMFKLRDIKGALYPDIYSSGAFAMVDHQIAHIYITDQSKIENIKKVFENTQGIKNVFPHTEIDHPRSGELILEAENGYWFAYPWWDKKNEAPDYATHVDIHNKPGFDPCELFLSLWPPMSISSDTSKIKGTHGASGDKVLLASSFETNDVNSIIETGKSIKEKLSDSS